MSDCLENRYSQFDIQSPLGVPMWVFHDTRASITGVH